MIDGGGGELRTAKVAVTSTILGRAVVRCLRCWMESAAFPKGTAGLLTSRSVLRQNHGDVMTSGLSGSTGLRDLNMSDAALAKC